MKKNLTKRKLSVFALFFFIIFLLVVYFLNVINPIIRTYSEAETRSLTEKAVNLAVSNVINRSINYDSLIDITYNSAGEISSLAANQYEINTISREIVKETQFLMNTLGEDGLKMNIGTFSGVPFLIGRGPKITLKLVPIGAVSSEFESQFNSVGINITKHTLYFYIKSHVSIVLPIKSYEVYSNVQVMLAESIIVGKVPEVYLNGGSLGQSLNLVP